MANETSINLSLADSTMAPSRPPYRADAPNVVVIVLDDLGFAQLGCYGSDLETPNLDRLAERGLRFTNFHTTAICSPTRACLLTGRNHHRVGMGMLPDMPIPYPAYTGQFPDSAGTMAQILLDAGWSTTAIGKWHLVPRDQRATGPFHMWPTRLGFERYYGFLNGETNQWTPNLVRDQTHIEPPRTPEEGYHLEADLADEAIAMLRDRRLHQPDRPFFLWYATAAPHAPHQAPAEWIDRFAGQFDDGWDAWRERTFERQKELGIVPADATLSDRPSWVEAWDDLDADRQRLYSRMMECFAGFLAHADHHIGRILDEIEASGQLENTIVVTVSDNGCSAEGGPNGSWNQLRHYIGDGDDDLDAELAHYDDLGGFRSSGHFPWGWALAGNTPFRRWKRYTFEGGVRDPLIVSWPDGLGDQGGIRDQYCHAVDLLPTVLDLVDVDVPAELGGVPQMSIDGVTIRDVLADAATAAPRNQQYYECWGSRAIYRDGWKAVTNHVNQLTAAERDNIEGSASFADDEWQLFDTTTDFSESHDLASTHPGTLAELVELWHEEAERNQVLPLDDGRDSRIAQLHLPWLSFQGTYHLRRGDKLHESNGPVLAFGFRMVAWFEDDLEPTASGVLCEQGDWIAGWAWFLSGGILTWSFVFDGNETRIEAAVPAGTRLVSLDGTPRADGGLDLVLRADDTVIAEGAFDGAVPLAIAPDGAFLTVGYGRTFPVVEDYEPPADAPGSLGGIRIDVGPPPPLDFDAELERVMRHQ
ncbi:MAG: arylsulfatase [Acidimicrobiales bacterium]|nr:arylsulfatase [Acidimicrobiales bacterium]